MLLDWTAKCMQVYSCIEVFQGNGRKATIIPKSMIKDRSIILFQLHEFAAPIHGASSEIEFANVGIHDTLVKHGYFDDVSSKRTGFVYIKTTVLNQSEEVCDVHYSIHNEEQDLSYAEFVVDVDSSTSVETRKINNTPTIGISAVNKEPRKLMVIVEDVAAKSVQVQFSVEDFKGNTRKGNNSELAAHTHVEDNVIESSNVGIQFWEDRHGTSQELVMFDDSKESIKEEPKILIRDNSCVHSHSREFATMIHGITNEGYSISDSTQNACVIFNKELVAVLLRFPMHLQIYQGLHQLLSCMGV
ncbi:hypothetical protein SUGI_1028400 [Cryptomeria japonica]|nr:hypothetical protein SUGI_1028400 [Cryptomeria japonica]